MYSRKERFIILVSCAFYALSDGTTFRVQDTLSPSRTRTEPTMTVEQFAIVLPGEYDPKSFDDIIYRRPKSTWPFYVNGPNRSRPTCRYTYLPRSRKRNSSEDVCRDFANRSFYSRITDHPNRRRRTPNLTGGGDPSKKFLPGELYPVLYRLIPETEYLH